MLEHVPDPPALLAEVARACRAVVIEVPLEANLSARRASKRAHAEEIGHLQRLDRAAARAIVARAGLRVGRRARGPAAAGGPPLLRARRAPQRARGYGEVGRARPACTALAPALARRLFTVHYACLCLPPAA